MRVLVLASQKGGVGKTTIAGHIAVAAEARGAGPVALIDTDPQGSLAAWWNGRKAETPLFARASVESLRDQLAALRDHGIALVVIDTPPAITESIRAVVEVADLVLIPTRPSPHDLRAVGATVDLIERCRRPMVFVVNGATPRARITADAAVALSQHGTVAPATLHQRVDFASSMIDGRTVQEVAPSSNSAREVADLWDYVNTRLSKIV
ncbi:ParA family protein [Paracraurococcus lichenis]|uniref:ParA family protein n=1 Tax=Paracraurococcus lichenis TaxID=3064888 RepID=A0ABT9EAC7_9PROT|nr:ParA family protein [Paracraurococcus sp. LOR1-02]MDO9713151.1 ParA family protein [Paracraurococcus sp. LOR1-02]